MASCATGDQAAFAELYELTVRRVYGTVLKVLRSPDHAQEVTQEVYVEVWRQAPRYTAEKGSVLAWLAAMAHRRAVDRVRSVSSEIARDERYAYATAEREGDEVWDSVAQQYEVERVRGAIAHPDPDPAPGRPARLLQGLTQSEISSLAEPADGNGQDPDPRRAATARRSVGRWGVDDRDPRVHRLLRPATPSTPPSSPSSRPTWPPARPARTSSPTSARPRPSSPCSPGHPAGPPAGTRPRRRPHHSPARRPHGGAGRRDRWPRSRPDGERGPEATPSRPRLGDPRASRSRWTSSRERRRGGRTRVLGGLVAAMLALAVGLGGVVYTLVQQRQAQVAQTSSSSSSTPRRTPSRHDRACRVAARSPSWPPGSSTGPCSSAPTCPTRGRTAISSGPAPGSDRQNGITGGDPRQPGRRAPSGVKVFFSGNVAAADFLAVNLEPAGSTPGRPPTTCWPPRRSEPPAPYRKSGYLGIPRRGKGGSARKLDNFEKPERSLVQILGRGPRT